ncbi:MAG: hypothetical protein KA746_00090 [Pyrinomonadaceae bacterium]|nr:hypothetical protein [Pyrinomonadaceae bacterium]MBP6212560.1 hypothetical protein [Pyrinomonadaceae bacterium]
MAANLGDLRKSEHRLYLALAVLFPLVVLAGFGRTYYLKFAFEAPPVPSTLVHFHSLVMTAWIALFIAQVYFISSKRIKTHMSLGMLGIALAILIVVIGFFTGAAAAKFGSASAPPGISPLSFFIVPFLDLIFFAAFFGAAMYFRKNAANHKRLMLLTMINFLPPAVARIPVASLQSLGPLFFFGVPTLVAIGFLVYDTVKTGKLNRVFLIGALALIVSYPLRLAASSTDAWMNFAAWVTTWAA